MLVSERNASLRQKKIEETALDDEIRQPQVGPAEERGTQEVRGVITRVHLCEA